MGHGNQKYKFSKNTLPILMLSSDFMVLNEIMFVINRNIAYFYVTVFFIPSKAI